MMKEIMPLYTRVMLEFYENDPYENSVTSNGLKMTDDKFLNPDTGEMDKKDFYSRTAHVIEAGPNCKYIKADDDIVVDIRSCAPVRFMGEVYFTTAEENIIAVIADDLKERFKK